MSFEVIQKALTIAAPLAIIVGVVIALLQLRNQNRLRQIDTVMSPHGNMTPMRTSRWRLPKMTTSLSWS